MITSAAILAACAWSLLLVVPWAPWRIRERLEAEHGSTPDLHDVTALVPARNEAARIGATLAALAAQGNGLAIVVVDDQSEDQTAAVVEHSDLPGISLVRGRPLPEDWSGKVWAQHQGEGLLDRPLALLVDADVELDPGMIAALRRRLDERGAGMVSVLAAPGLDGFWERLLMPAFVFFFRLLYPFALANRSGARTAAAAGGCVLIRTDVLAAIGGFSAIAGELIDDCALARRVKDAGFPVWIGLTRSARSRRAVRGPGDLWRMVARTAYTQLGYSPLALAGCTVAMLLAFAAPVIALAGADPAARVAGIWAIAAATAGYLPTVRYYRLAGGWVAGLFPAGALFLAMTWSSAVGYWRGRRSEWHGRVYRRRPAPR